MIPSFYQKISSYAKFAELIFFPSFCELCSSLLEYPKEKVICHSCWDGIEPSYSSCCLCCGQFFGGSGGSHFCGNCLQKRPPFSLHRSCAKYEGILKDVIILYKYRHFKVLGKDLACFVDRALGEKVEIWEGVNAVVPVPLHPARRRKRGFNQSQIIAKELAKLRRVELMEGILVKTKNVLPQTSLEVNERKKNVRGAFKVIKGERIRDKVILLVDDVYTTGSTIRECSSVLKEAGVKEIRALSIAQA